MTPDLFADWHLRRGHRVLRTVSSYWVEAGPHVFQAFPYHWLIEPSADEFRQLFGEHKALGVRYSTSWDAPQGAASYHVVYTAADYPLERLPKKARHDVQKGLRVTHVEPISFDRLATEGWELRRETLARQHRSRAETQAEWRSLCRSAAGLPGFEAWAAIADGQMAAALIAFTCEDCCSILYQQSRTAFLPAGVNNALSFVFTQEVLQRPGKPWLFYGLHSLDAPPSVDEFKFRMGYTAKPVRQRVVFHPALAPLFNPASHALLEGLLRLWPGSPFLAKTEGLVRFYLQGRQPLTRQPFPPPLLEN